MTRVLFEHPICTAEGFPVETRGGTREFVRLRMPDWVNVVPVTTDGRVVLIRQHRWGVDADTLEIPGGIVDPGEAPEQAAVRELREETGYGGGSLEPLGWAWPNPAIQTNRLFLYAARGVHPVGAPQPDEGEQIEVETVPVARLPHLLEAGEIAHALVVVALQRFLMRRAAPPGV